MPKVRPLTKEQRNMERWKAQDQYIRAKIGALKEISGMSEKEIGLRLGMKAGVTIRKKIDFPGTMTLGQERMLAAMFEEHGIPFDFAKGEGASA